MSGAATSRDPGGRHASSPLIRIRCAYRVRVLGAVGRPRHERLRREVHPVEVHPVEVT